MPLILSGKTAYTTIFFEKVRLFDHSLGESNNITYGEASFKKPFFFECDSEIGSHLNEFFTSKPIKFDWFLIKATFNGFVNIFHIVEGKDKLNPAIELTHSIDNI